MGIRFPGARFEGVNVEGAAGAGQTHVLQQTHDHDLLAKGDSCRLVAGVCVRKRRRRRGRRRKVRRR